MRDRDALLVKVAGIGRTVSLAADLTWHRVHRAVDEPGQVGRLQDVGGYYARRAPRLPLADGVVEQEGEVILARAANPARDAALPLRAAAAAAQAGLEIAPATVHRLARLCPPLTDPWPPAALDAFVSLLGAGESMINVWESLDQAGLVSAMLPGWERLRSMPQWDPIHVFTVDRHMMETAVNAANLVRRVRRPTCCSSTAIFHDIGKGLGGDHSVLGAEHDPAVAAAARGRPRRTSTRCVARPPPSAASATPPAGAIRTTRHDRQPSPRSFPTSTPCNCSPR